MTTKTDLKSFFEAGDQPTQGQFHEWMDSYWHKDESPQIKIATNNDISTLTKNQDGHSQQGKNVLVDHSSNNIKIVLNKDSDANFAATYVKLGTGTITFSAGTGTTLEPLDYTSILNGKVGSTALLFRNGDTFYLRIYNA